MKKISFLILSMLLITNTFAFKFQHKQIHNLSNNKKMLHEDDENFSGTWMGNCDNEELQLTISQDNEQVTLIFPGYDGKTTSKTSS